MNFYSTLTRLATGGPDDDDLKKKAKQPKQTLQAHDDNKDCRLLRQTTQIA